jgi:hypothetical protein
MASMAWSAPIDPDTLNGWAAFGALVAGLINALGHIFGGRHNQEIQNLEHQRDNWQREDNIHHEALYSVQRRVGYNPSSTFKY